MPLRPAKPCDAPNRLWAFLPVSMTTLDLLYAVLLLGLSLVLLRNRSGTGRTERARQDGRRARADAPPVLRAGRPGIKARRVRGRGL